MSMTSPSPQLGTNSVDAPDERNKRAARLHHRRNFRNQIALWTLSIIVAVASYPVQSVLIRAYTTQCLAPSSPRDASCLFDPRIAVNAFFIIIFIIALAVLVAYYYIYYLYHTKSDWDLAVEKAQNPRDITVSAGGHIELFDIYVKNKRRSYHLITYGALGMLCPITAIIAAFRIPGGAQMFYAPGFLLMIAIQIALGLCCFHLAYRIGSSYLPGQIIVEHTIFLATKTLFPQITVIQLTERTEPITIKFKNEHPELWW